jgi:ribosome-binding protein aMBF1 (putative translation factor)
MTTTATATTAQSTNNAAAASQNTSTAATGTAGATQNANAQAQQQQQSTTAQTQTTQTQSTVPEKYEFKVPEGYFLGDAHKEKIATYAREQGLSQEKAQQLLERDHGLVSEYQSSQMKELDQRRAAWVEQSTKDPEIGGQHLTENVELAKRVVDKFGSEALKEELRNTRFGDHPEVVRIFAKIGRAMGDDKTVHASAHVTEKKSLAERIYSKHSKKE